MSKHCAQFLSGIRGCLSLEIGLHSFVNREWCQDDLELALVGNWIPASSYEVGRGCRPPASRKESGSVAYTSHIHLLSTSLPLSLSQSRVSQILGLACHPRTV